MAIVVTCPKCAHSLKVKDELAGKRGKCPQCDAIISIPAAKPPSPAIPAKPTAPAPPVTKPVTPPAKPAAPAALPADPRAAVLGAFQGRLTLPRVSLVRKIGTLLVLAILLVLLLVYVAMLAGLAWAAYKLATGDFPNIPSAAVSAGMVGAVILLLCLLRPALMPRRRALKTYPLPPDREKLLHELLAKICEQLDCQPPTAVQTELSSRLSAETRGALGPLQSDVVLTLGLPLVAGLTVEQLAGLIAGQLALYRRGSACRPTNLIRAINGWLWRSVFQEDRFDQWITRMNLRPGFHAGRLLLPLKAFSFPARVLLWIPMFIGNTAAAALVRLAELDADRCHARLSGAKSFAAALERERMIDFTWGGILTDLGMLHSERQLPDSLPQLLNMRMRDVTPELAETLIGTVINPGDIPFDSRPSDAERLAAVRGEPAQGVLTCPLPAQIVLADYSGLARDITWDHYTATFGGELSKSALKRIDWTPGK